MPTIELHETHIYKVLDTVKDPEIDTVSIIDLGMIERVQINDGHIRIEVLPTFSGCPALTIIQQNIEKAISQLENVREVAVVFINNPTWTSDRVTAKGREGLKQFGIAPPPRFLNEDGSWHVDCPYCGSTYVTLENIFGPTACRSILYCKSCKNPFEAMKLISTSM